MNSDFNYIVSLQDACKLFNTSETTLKRNIKNGKFKENIDFKFIAGRFFFKINELCNIDNLIDEKEISDKLKISLTFIKTLRNSYLIENVDFKYFGKTIIYNLQALDKLKKVYKDHHNFKLKNEHFEFIGKKINQLTILDVKSIKTNLAPTKTAHYLCKCDCENEKWIPCSAIKSLRVKSCGCAFENVKTEHIKIIAKNNLENMIIDNVNINAINRDTTFSNNTSGVTGVRWDKSRERWLSEIKFKKKRYFLGRYKNKEDAIKARKDAEEKLHKRFLREKGLLD